MTLLVGDRAPDFSLPATTGTVQLSEVVGRKMAILAFYPKDNTSG